MGLLVLCWTLVCKVGLVVLIGLGVELWIWLSCWNFWNSAAKSKAELWEIEAGVLLG